MTTHISKIPMAALAIVGLFAVPVHAGTVVASKHDLRAVGGLTPTGTGLLQVCVPCHTPHQATTALAQDPLWNHTASAAGSYGVYASSTMNAVPVAFDGGTTLGTLNTSQLCMSCHDGTISVLSMYKAPNLGGTPTVATLAGRVLASGLLDPAGGAYVGNTLADDHPVNFTYDAALATADGGLTTPDSLTCVTTTAGCTVPLFTAGVTSAVQCATCHDPHDPTNQPFLRVTNVASALCLTCHIK